MAQWNSWNQYQGSNAWNEEPNRQYVNQRYFQNRQDSNGQYVSFNEFISQIQNNPPVSGNGPQFSNVQYENYPTTQYSYQNVPGALNTQMDNYTVYGQSSSNIPSNTDLYRPNSQAQYGMQSHAFTNDLILKSNLTPTATEFVPKNMLIPSVNSQDMPGTSTTSNDVAESRSKHCSSSDTNWRERPQSSQQTKEQNKESNDYSQDNRKPQSNGRNRESSSGQSNGQYFDTTSRNYERNQYDYSSRNSENNRSYETNNRNDKRGQMKQNSKYKTKDTEPRMFYNSSINKDSQDVRNGRGEGFSKQKNRVGSQRLRNADRHHTEDEQYANTYYQQREDRSEKNKQEHFPSPSKYKNKNIDQGHKEMTQRERLTEQLEKGSLECLVCCERVKQIDPVWSCGNCYHVFHLRCIRKWAISSMVEGNWRCPACQNANNHIPTEYRCMCGAIRNPDYNRGTNIAHTCGKSCKRPRSCPHPCTLLCHPGPCPACQATVVKQCSCGAETRSVLCSSKLPQVCGRVCNRALECGVHHCQRECHEEKCDTCTKTVDQVCHCPAAKSQTVPCTKETSQTDHWSCGTECGRVLTCGAHVCRQKCHPPPCLPCLLLPDTVLTCPCGKTKLEKDQRKSCTDPIPLCGNICAKPLTCGPSGDKHFCKANCHEGPCPDCPETTLVACRCDHSNREVPCVELPEMINNVVCQKKCNKKLSCGRHRCRSLCCAKEVHRCALVCSRSLTCQTHRCEEFCHTGRCEPCPRLSFEELRCECGAQVILPPVPCGTKPPACSAPCRRPRDCGHPPHHHCHSGECPGCVVLTTKRCHGDHEERKTIPCFQEEFSCGLPCGKPLPCGKHTCIKICHKGPCDTGKCTQPCNEKRLSCGHPCAAPCHFGAEPESNAALCPSTGPCRKLVRATCPCGRRSAERQCCDNARDFAKIMSALAATKIQEGGSVDISDVQRPSKVLQTLECEEECRAEARARQLALALQIRNPDVSSKLAPRYSEHVRSTATREPAFAMHVHDKLTDLVQLAKKSKQKTRAHSFPSMNWQKRQFIHEMCEHFGCESVAYDAEPNRNVVATADREKSWLPAMSIMEVLAREAGKRRVPGPILRSNTNMSASGSAPAPGSSSSATYASKSSGGWATLTSTNAWAARSQPKPQTTDNNKIDYFDNPPDK